MDDFDVYEHGSYQQVLCTGQVGKQWARIHRQIEEPYVGRHFTRILEVGAGTGEHVEHVASTFDEYVMSDVRFDLLERSVIPGEGVVAEYQDVQAISYPDDSFDRVIVTCVLAHVTDPVRALLEIKRVARPDASISIYLPCEPGLLLRLARRVITIPKNHKAGVPDPYYQHFREHIHYYLALNHFIHKVFASSRIGSRYYPFRIGTWNSNLYRIYHIDVAKP